MANASKRIVAATVPTLLALAVLGISAPTPTDVERDTSSSVEREIQTTTSGAATSTSGAATSTSGADPSVSSPAVPTTDTNDWDAAIAVACLNQLFNRSGGEILGRGESGDRVEVQTAGSRVSIQYDFERDAPDDRSGVIAALNHLRDVCPPFRSYVERSLKHRDSLPVLKVTCDECVMAAASPSECSDQPLRVKKVNDADRTTTLNGAKDPSLQCVIEMEKFVPQPATAGKVEVTVGVDVIIPASPGPTTGATADERGTSSSELPTTPPSGRRDGDSSEDAEPTTTTQGDHIESGQPLPYPGPKASTSQGDVDRSTSTSGDVRGVSGSIKIKTVRSL